MLAAGQLSPAAADGGRGGRPDNGSDTGGASGIDNPTGAGGAGGTGTSSFAGGGGGGAGAVTGGAGGFRNGGAAGFGQGGIGGVHGSVDSGLPAGNSTGSAGGVGADGSGSSGGGGGGAGGYGAVVTGAGTTGTVSGTIAGGNGGAGGNSAVDYGGSGGSGGIGLFFNDGSLATTLTVDGAGQIQGGNGGARGTGGSGVGNHGAGGAGIVGSNLSITTSGTISGGLSGDGTTRAAAIRFTGGTNSLTFGNASSGVTGDIVVEAGTLTFAQPTNTTVANVVSGAGAVVKSGAGTLTLTGTNTYTGGTTLSGGTLSISADANLGDVSGALTLDGGVLQVTGTTLTQLGRTIVFGANGGGFDIADAGNSFTVTDSFTGAGGLSKAGAGTLLVTGSNDYSGPTTVLAGRLVTDSSTGFSTNSDYTIAAGAELEVIDGGGGTFAAVGSLSGAGTVEIGTGAALVTGWTNQTTTFSGSFSGGGSLEFTGSGTQIYTGTGSLGGGFLVCACGTGQFVIRGGSLSFGSDIQVQGGTLVIDQGGTLGNGNNTLFVAGAVRVDGTGSSLSTGILLMQSFSGTATLTVSGGATLSGSGGASLVGFGGAARALVTGAGSRWSVGGGGLSLGGGFSTDAVSVTVADGGELRLTSGDLQIDAQGTLNIGNGGRAGTITIAAGSILNDGAIVADFTDTATLAADISGSGSLSKAGSGTLTLTGANTYTGGTTVTGGKLVVNGSITGSVTLNGGTIGGSGNIGTLSVASGATVAPGNSIGTLTINGNVSFAAGSVYQVEVNAAGQGDRIVASGTATITGGTVEVLAENGNYAASTDYIILTASGGVGGQFTRVTSNLVFLTPSLSYGGSSVTLTMTRTATSFAEVAASRNQGFIGGAAEGLGVGNPVYDTLLSSTAEQARAGFDLLSGEAHAQAVSAMIGESGLVREAILSRLRGPLLTAPGQSVAAAFSADLPGRKGAVLMTAPTPQPRYVLWGEALGGQGNSNADGNAAGLERRSGGAMLGADLMLHDSGSSSLRVGLAGGYTQSRFDLDARLSKGRLESGHAALYAGARFGDLRFDAGLAYSWSESDIRRQVQIRGFGDLLRSERPGAVLQGFAELGYAFRFQGLALEPFAQLALLRVSTEAGVEQGGATALRLLASEQVLGFSTLGLRAEAQLAATPVFARAMLGWRHGFGELTPRALTAFASGSTPARVFAARIDRNALAAEVGLDWRASSSTTLGLTYAATLGERSRDHALKGRVDIRF